MKKKKNYSFFIILGVIAAGIAFALLYTGSRPGEYDSFAQCLSDNGAKMYAAWWCPHCQEQKKDFGNSFRILEDSGAHIECGGPASGTITDFCKSQGINSVPRWRLQNGTELVGRQRMEVLAQAAGCALI